MEKFIREKAVLICEEEELQKRACATLGWSYQAWQRRKNGTTPLSDAERFALDTILSEMRGGAKILFVLPEKN